MRVFGIAAALTIAFLPVQAAAADQGPAQLQAGGGPVIRAEADASAGQSAEPALINPAPPEVAGPPAPVNSSDAAAAGQATPAPASNGGSVTSPEPATAPAEAAAKVAEVPPPEPTLLVDINLTTQRMTVSEHGEQKHTWAISSARAGYRTPTGTFSPAWMSRMWYSRQYDWSPMPHAIFFHRGVAIHATYATRMLGRPASHGCVRLAPANAAALYKMVGKHGKSMTSIVVHGTPKHGPAVARGGEGPRYSQRRNTYWSGYSYYAPRPAYKSSQRAKRLAASRPYYYPPQRRYVSRGLFQPGY